MTDSRRILVTGLSTYWGGRLAQALERAPDVEAVIGVDSEEPCVELDRTEYVKVGAQHALLPKIGCVPAHPANVHRLLCDERQLVLVFPEGRKGTEKLYKDRYRLRRFGRGGFVEAAMRARAPIVPVAVVGAEEAAPVFAQLGLFKRLTGLLYFPITPTFPHFGLLGMLGYLPAKFKIRFLEPIRFDEEGMHEDKALVQTVAHDVRARIQENLWDMLSKRRSVWFG